MGFNSEFKELIGGTGFECWPVDGDLPLSTSPLFACVGGVVPSSGLRSQVRGWHNGTDERSSLLRCIDQ